MPAKRKTKRTATATARRVAKSPAPRRAKKNAAKRKTVRRAKPKSTIERVESKAVEMAKGIVPTARSAITSVRRAISGKK